MFGLKNKFIAVLSGLVVSLESRERELRAEIETCDAEYQELYEISISSVNHLNAHLEDNAETIAGLIASNKNLARWHKRRGDKLFAMAQENTQLRERLIEANHTLEHVEALEEDRERSEGSSALYVVIEENLGDYSLRTMPLDRERAEENLGMRRHVSGSTFMLARVQG